MHTTAGTCPFLSFYIHGDGAVAIGTLVTQVEEHEGNSSIYQ